MKEVWTKDPEEISGEIAMLTEKRSPLTLYQKGKNSHTTTADQIEENDQKKILVLSKDNSFQAPKDACLFLYHPEGEGIRCFKALPVKETETQLKVSFPSEIIRVQRRRHERIISTGMSTVVFTRKGSHNLLTGEVKDISVEGAKITGKFTPNIKKGDLLAPISITLRLRHGNFEEKINVPEATVARTISSAEETTGLGIKFLMPVSERERFETYVTLRALEDKAL